jgi:alkylation response protein AidB-like acyl-CoA dehydrogenase
MNFDDTAEEAAWRRQVRDWLSAHAELRSTEDHSTFGDRSPAAEAEHVARARRWQHALFAGGYAGITWPKEYGGRGGTSLQAMIFNQEQAAFAVDTGPFTVGVAMAGPTLIAHGTDEQKARYLGPLLRGEEIWCQLFSEPGAGSDLAGLATRAVRDGDEYVVNGQKVWTSGAHYSDLAILLARTDPDQPKHRGITYFVLDMRSPGIDIRPLRQMTGGSHFNEVFLTDVRVPVGNAVGAPNNGWRVAMTTLANERTAIGGGGSGVRFPELVRLATRFGRARDPYVRQRLAALYTDLEVIRYLGFRVQTALSQGRPVGPESSVLKLAYSRHVAALGDVALALAGPAGALAGRDAPDDGYWQLRFLGQYGIRIGGGTDEVQRNVIGERVLGLPGEPRADKELSYRELSGRA